MLTDEGYISNYLGVNITKLQMGYSNYRNRTWWRKIIKHVRLTVSVSLKARDTPDGKKFLHKDIYSLGRKCVYNYMEAVGMLSNLQGST